MLLPLLVLLLAAKFQQAKGDYHKQGPIPSQHQTARLHLVTTLRAPVEVEAASWGPRHLNNRTLFEGA